MEKELLSLQQENDILSNQLAMLESKSMHFQENDNLLMDLDSKYYIYFLNIQLIYYLNNSFSNFLIFNCKCLIILKFLRTYFKYKRIQPFITKNF